VHVFICCGLEETLLRVLLEEKLHLEDTDAQSQSEFYKTIGSFPFSSVIFL